jgi:hypothetical protein
MFGSLLLSVWSSSNQSLLGVEGAGIVMQLCETACHLVWRIVRTEFETDNKMLVEVIHRNYRSRWRAQGDDLRTFLCDFVACLPHVEFPAALSL